MRDSTVLDGCLTWPLPWQRPWRPGRAAAACLLVAAVEAAPRLEVWKALELRGEPWNENLATNNQAMGVWHDGAEQSRELVVALIHQYGDMDRRADDQQYAVAWESDGSHLREVYRVPMSCPDVELAVPSRGPFVYESRMELVAGSLHPECSCREAPGRPCPAGVVAEQHGEGFGSNEPGVVTLTWTLSSPVESHFVSLENEWKEVIPDQAVLGRLTTDVVARVMPITTRVLNAGPGANPDPMFACPGSRDDLLGGPDVTFEQLTAGRIRLPYNHVDGRWCLVRRGGCSETAKVKVCELSGAAGTIIIDHGNFQGDQSVVIRYSRSAGESASKPVLFVSHRDGESLLDTAAQAGKSVWVRVGPSVAGTPPPGYTPGSGLIVHKIGDSGGGDVTRKSYPTLFGTAGWIEVSEVRDIMFVCLQDLSEVRMFDVSEPLVNIPRLGTIETACKRSGTHDYRVLDYLDLDGRYKTLLADPADRGNNLYYYDTHDPMKPSLWRVLHANWESTDDGLGQVRPGGLGGKFHIVSWHCSTLYCGKNRGDSVYFVDLADMWSPAKQVKLPMLSNGGMVRDIACSADAVCVLSLTWDGLVALDSGTNGTANPLSVVSTYTGLHPFSETVIPAHMAHLRLYSGAQKVYSSRKHLRSFYVEHADFSLRPLRLGDYVRAVQLNQVYMAVLKDYDASASVVTYNPRQQDTDVPVVATRPPLRDDTMFESDNGSEFPMSIAAVLIGLLGGALMLLTVFVALLVRSWHANRLKQNEITYLRRSHAPSGGSNVVVGRPVPLGGGGNGLPKPTVVSVGTRSPANASSGSWSP